MRQVLILLSLALVSASPAWADALPTVHEVYSTAESGRLHEARVMVEKVLEAKPDSAKAHYVKAEICAAQSDLACVRSELKTAEKIEPGLPFANPNAVAKLEAKASGQAPMTTMSHHAKRAFPWGWLLLGLGIVALLIWIVSIANRRGQARGPMTYNGMPNSPSYPGSGMGGMAPGYGTPMQGGGLGSTLGRGLATGAAIGAGMVAGEALADGLFHHGDGGAPMAGGLDTSPASTPDLGGNDFGINDGDGWDGMGGGDFDSFDDGSNW